MMDNNLTSVSKVDEKTMKRTFEFFKSEFFQDNWMRIVICIIGIIGSLGMLLSPMIRKNYLEQSIKHFKTPTGEVFRLDRTDLQKKIFYSGNRSFSMEDCKIIDP